MWHGARRVVLGLATVALIVYLAVLVRDAARFVGASESTEVCKTCASGREVRVYGRAVPMLNGPAYDLEVPALVKRFTTVDLWLTSPIYDRVLRVTGHVHDWRKIGETFQSEAVGWQMCGRDLPDTRVFWAARSPEFADAVQAALRDGSLTTAELEAGLRHPPEDGLLADLMNAVPHE